MATSFTFSGATAGGGEAATLAPLFDYVIAYEDRDEVHTSRWALQGLRTADGGNTDRGWLWMRCALAGNVVTVDLFKAAACASADKVATGTADISLIPAAAARCALSAANASGMTGELYLQDYLADPAAAVPLCATLCVDTDLQDEYRNLSDLPSGVYDATAGLARYGAAATRKTLLLAGQMYAEELGGFGAPEHRHAAGASRTAPDYRRLANPDQLKDAAVHWALMLAFGACHELARDTMYSALRDYHDQKRKEAIAAWRLTFNVNPDDDRDADRAKSAGSARITRL